MTIAVSGNRAAWLTCALTSLVGAVLASPDSPFTHSELCHIDTAWFLDAGRWLMQGLVPYVDFADSKGPLLWLWYGLGYLLDPTGWSGMFWLYALYYVFVYRMVWASARLMLGSDRAAAFTVIAMPIAYMAFLHTENRPEDLAQLPLAYLIYLVVKVWSGHSLRRADLVWAGVSLGAMLFVKWSFPAMLLPLPFIAVAYDARAKASGQGRGAVLLLALRQIAWLLAGAMAVCAAVCLWMLLAGALRPMLHEYFIGTFQTIGNDNGFDIRGLLASMAHTLPHRKWTIIWLLSVPYVSVRLYDRKGWWLFIAFLYMVLFYFLHYMSYYERVADTFGLFTPVAFLLLVRGRCPLRHSWMLAAEAVCVCAFLYVMVRRHHENYGHTPPLAEFRAMTCRIDSLHDPRILYFDLGDYSLGVKSGALPPCRYWARQCGATPAMVRDQIDAMRTGRADVVVTESGDTTPAHYGYRTHPVRDLFPCPYPTQGPFRTWWHPRHSRP